VKVRLHKGYVGEIDEIYLYTAAAYLEWQNTPLGQWCKDRGIETDYTTAYSASHYGVEFCVFGEMKDKDYILYLLKFEQGAKNEHRST